MSHATLAPGETCSGCGRRKPYPRQESSPDTRTVSKHIPVDEFDAHAEVAEAAARHLGVFDRPHWRYLLDTFAYARVLQDASLKDVGKPAPVDDWQGVYPGMCVDPETCRGRSSCPRDYSCCE